MFLATGFLTVLPVPTVSYVAGELGRAVFWFPWVGLAIGGLLWLVQGAAMFWFGPWLVAVLVVVAWAGLTGALHLDGVADCCDGLLASVGRERRLEIMRDPRVGAFGVVGLVLFLGAKIAAVAELTLLGWASSLPVLLLAPMWARWLMLWAARTPSARPGGMGDAFRETLTLRGLFVAGVLPVAILLLIPLATVAPLAPVAPANAGGFFVGLGGAGGAIVCAWAIVGFTRARLGGITGDVLGLTVEGGELAFLLFYLAFFAALASPV